MIVYSATKQKFREDIDTNNIHNIIRDNLLARINLNVARNELNSYANSLLRMDRILEDKGIPDNCGVAIEYNIPQSSKRVDFILSGYGAKKELYTIIIELKQWENAERTQKDGIVRTRFQHGNVETTHPSYQAWSYAKLLEGFNEYVYTGNVNLRPCAYLHNFDNANGVLVDPFYSQYVSEAPVFMRDDAVKLRNYIKKFIIRGDDSKIIQKIDSSEIRPSKALADSLVTMLRNQPEFTMIDDQKIVFEEALALAKKSNDKVKNVLIIEGGPGTGKSVVAINLLARLTELRKNSMYVSKNAAPRSVYESKLAGTLTRNAISNLFSGSGAFINTQKNFYHALIVDEAHRLNEKSGLYGVNGKNQIKEIINSAKLSIFFLDENQRVTIKDIGEIKEISNWAKKLGAKVTNLQLSSQFRCNGSDRYISWLDNTLQIKNTANNKLSDINYDFKIFDSPTKLRNEIIKLNKERNKARMVAGYCWDWISKRNGGLFDIEFEKYNFKMKWNLAVDGSLWIISPDSVNEIGCIHTCQGLELDYIGVIVGPDFIVRDNKVITDASKRSKNDSSVKGARKMLREDYKNSYPILDKIIKNTYRTLMTRGMKGCYVYFTDKQTEEYFKSFIT